MISIGKKVKYHYDTETGVFHISLFGEIYKVYLINNTKKRQSGKPNLIEDEYP